MMNFLYGVAATTTGWVMIMAAANGHRFMFVVAMVMALLTAMTWFVEYQVEHHKRKEENARGRVLDERE